jgi:ribosomal protein S18 acetylase RimI-like enzyme
VHALTHIRSVRTDDVTALKMIIDATELFPSQLLDGMLEGWLSGNRPNECWQTDDAGAGPLAVTYSAPEPMTDGTSNLLLIAVDPKQHGQGIGQALMRDAEETLAARGQRVLLVETSGLPEFERTREFYRQLGYTQEARIRDYYAAGDHKIVYWKALR